MYKAFTLLRSLKYISRSKHSSNRWLRGSYPDHGPGGGGGATIRAHHHHQDIHSVLHAARLANVVVVVYSRGIWKYAVDLCL